MIEQNYWNYSRLEAVISYRALYSILKDEYIDEQMCSPNILDRTDRYFIFTGLYDLWEEAGRMKRKKIVDIVYKWGMNPANVSVFYRNDLFLLENKPGYAQDPARKQQFHNAMERLNKIGAPKDTEYYKYVKSFLEECSEL